MSYKKTGHIVSLSNAKSTVKTDPIPSKDTVKATSLFQNHLLVAKSSEPQLHITNYDYGVAGILFLSFVLYVWLFVTNRKRLNQVIKSFYINRYANQLAREEMALGNRVSIFLSVMFVFTLTIFFGEVIKYYGFITTSGSITFFLSIGLCIVIAYGIKLVCIKLLGFIFETPKVASDYILTLFLFANTCALFMLPVSVCVTFVKQVSPLVFIYTGFGILILFLVIRLIRGLIIGFNNPRASKFYLFLYLCTLEILPFVIMIKLFLLKINHY
jgi:hypothetical protein